MALISSNNQQEQQGDWPPLLSLAHIAVSYLGRSNSDDAAARSSIDENVSRPASSSPTNSGSNNSSESELIAKTLSDRRSRKRLLDRFLESTVDKALVQSRKSPKTIDNHISNSQQQYVCEECNKSYSTASNLSRHRQIHAANGNGETVSCPTCGKEYVSQAALSMHIMTHNMTYSCEFCGKKFSRPWLLQGHLRCHTHEKPFSCEVCGKSFADRSNLRVHTRLHSAAKSHNCPKCQRPFALKSYVIKHLETCKSKQPANDL